MDSLSMVVAKGLYQFKINHLKTKDMGIGEWIASPTFRVGPHDWVILYYPQGKMKYCSDKSVSSAFLEVQREFLDVKATFGFALLDKQGTVSSSSLRVISQTFASPQNALGVPVFVERTTLEDTYVKDGYFVLQVSITVKDESCGVSHESTCPTRFACERIRKFREENKQTDVTFDVKGKKFVAHRLILAAHSPVFEAEFFGSMAESKMKCISIKEMVPSVFKAMLDFMYNGSLPISEKLNNSDKPMSSVFFQKLISGDEPMSSVCFLQNLLAASDRYAIGPLKALCEHKLVERISLDTVVSLLESAEKHNCRELKKKCFLFIVAKDNSVSLMFNEGYILLMHNYPSLLAELQEMASK